MNDVDAIDGVVKRAPRRKHSARFKAEVLEACRQPDASAAAIARLYNLNANVVHRWRADDRKAASPKAPFHQLASINSICKPQLAIVAVSAHGQQNLEFIMQSNATPASAEAVRPTTASERQTSHMRGVEAGWVMPVALRNAAPGMQGNSDDGRLPGPRLTRRVSGAALRRVLPGCGTIEELKSDGFVLHSAAREVHLVADGPIQLAEFTLRDEYVRSVALDCFGPEVDTSDLSYGECVMRRDAQSATMLDEYLRLALREGPQPTRIEMDSRANLIMLRLLRGHSSLASAEALRQLGGLSPSRLRRVCDAMTRDLAADVPLQSLAQMLDVSYHHFCHAFKESVGMAPYQWLVERRVERACELLCATRDSIGDIAAAVGYDDPSQLARVFRTRRGTSPAAYRRECGVWATQT